MFLSVNSADATRSELDEDVVLFPLEWMPTRDSRADWKFRAGKRSSWATKTTDDGDDDKRAEPAWQFRSGKRSGEWMFRGGKKRAADDQLWQFRSGKRAADDSAWMFRGGKKRAADDQLWQFRSGKRGGEWMFRGGKKRSADEAKSDEEVVKREDPGWMFRSG